jgi:signal transduction histidine kinase
MPISDRLSAEMKQVGFGAVSTGYGMRNIHLSWSAIELAARRLRLMLSTLPARWRACSLATQFTAVAAVVMGIIMAVLGTWISARIESSVVSNTAASAALYMDRFIEPHVQDLARSGELGAPARQALAQLIKSRGFAQQIFDIMIWRPDGTIVYSNRDSVIGKKLPLSRSLQQALNGTVVPEFNHLDDEENIEERGLALPLLEIYAPLHEANSERVIAVAEFYQYADILAKQLQWSRLESIFIVGGLTLLMLGALSGIVRRASQTINTQQRALNDRIAELSRSLRLNEDLSQRVTEATRRAAESSEQFLRRVSAELHDGPVQLIGLVLLRLDGIGLQAAQADPGRALETLTVIRGALQDALAEIRGLSNGFALPELENLKLEEALELAIHNHERRSGTDVSASFPKNLPAVPIAVKICAYRFVQEGLNNAFRHAGGIGQSVTVTREGNCLRIDVADEGPGLPVDASSPAKGGIGLAGLRDRIESLGGTMTIESAEGKGTKLRALFILGGS